MEYNDEIVQQYFTNKDILTSDSHWIYSFIEKDKILYEKPLYTKIEIVKQVHREIIAALDNFKFFNDKLITEVFPNIEDIKGNSTIILVVGCPKPYDAVIREYNGQEYIIFDLIRFAEYADSGYSLELLIRKLLTHELLHKCIHDKYPIVSALSYIDELNYIAFDEGFAHLLAYKDNIKDCEFDDFLTERYLKAKHQLKQAITEKDSVKQKDYLSFANTGSYWDKFAAISGKLYLLKHIEHLHSIYNNGWYNFINEILS